MSRPKSHDYPPFRTVDGCGGFYVRNPITQKKQRFGDEALARRAAERLGIYIAKERQLRLEDAGLPTVGSVIDPFKEDEMRFMPWRAGTETNCLAKSGPIQREIGHRPIRRIDAVFLADWIGSFCATADTWNKWRFALLLLWKYGLSKGYVKVNYTENVMERSMSLVITSNHKQRRPLDVAGYKAIHETADPWLQLAMDISLLTLQGRSDVVNLRHTDFRDGHVFMIREKVGRGIHPDQADARDRATVFARSPARQYRLALSRSSNAGRA